MKFAEYKTCMKAGEYRQAIHNLVSYPALVDDVYKEDPLFIEIIHAENLWIRSTRPYYKVWPSIIQPLLRTPLNIALGEVPSNGPKVIVLRTASYAALVHRWERDRLIAVSPGSEDRIEIIGGDSIETQLRSPFLGAGKSVDCLSLEQILRLYVGVQLLCSDARFINPDVLDRDKKKFESSGDRKFAERAKRRGKFGWNVGEHLESVPHLRRPHFGIRYGYWGGEEITPRLRPVKGAVVHRDKMRRIPTGYITPEGVEIEPA